MQFSSSLMSSKHVKKKIRKIINVTVTPSKLFDLAFDQHNRPFCSSLNTAICVYMSDV